MNRHRTFITTLIIALLFVGPSFAQLRGKVVKIADGDTFTLLTDDKRQVKIRLHGIDCPEHAQPHGTKAKQFTSNLVFGKLVSAQVRFIFFS